MIALLILAPLLLFFVVPRFGYGLRGPWFRPMRLHRWGYHHRGCHHHHHGRR
jgi:hypothetical protein